jgi:MYXO-CTERM domain-containing protein
MLTGSLGVIELPELSGFVLDLVAVQPELPRADSPYFDYLGLYANLGLAAAPLPAPRATQARVLRVATPVRSRMSVFAPGEPEMPQVEVAVGAEGVRPAEFSWRLDGGAWSIFRPGPRLTVRSPLLLLEGEHRLEVRARTVGDYRSLDPQPVELPVLIAPEDDGLRYEPLPSEEALAAHGLAPAEQTRAVEGDAQQEPARIGCATSGGRGWTLGLIALVGLLVLVRRRRR